MRRVLLVLVVAAAAWALRRRIRDALIRLTGTSVVTAEPLERAPVGAAHPVPDREAP